MTTESGHNVWLRWQTRCEAAFLRAAQTDPDLWGGSVLDLCADQIPEAPLSALKSAIARSHLIAANASPRVRAQITQYGFKGLGEHDPRTPGQQKYNSGFVPEGPDGRENHDFVEASEHMADTMLFSADHWLKEMRPGACAASFDALLEGAAAMSAAEVEGGYVVPVAMEKHLEHTTRTFKKKCLIKRK